MGGFAVPGFTERQGWGAITTPHSSGAAAMADIVDRSSAMPRFMGKPIGQAAGRFCGRGFCIAAFLALCWSAGISPNGDFDDILKLMKVRAYLETGSWFDRTIPGVLQPEPFASHWPRILDLPYAAVAWLLTPFAGSSAALGDRRLRGPAAVASAGPRVVSQDHDSTGVRAAAGGLLARTDSGNGNPVRVRARPHRLSQRSRSSSCWRRSR